MKIIAFITAIILAATMTVSAVLKPPVAEAEPPAPAIETIESMQPSPASATDITEPMQPKPAPVIKEEIIEEPVPEEIAEPAPAPKKEIVPAPAPEPTTAPEVIVDHAKTSPESVPEIVVDHAKTEPEIIIDSAKTGSEVVKEEPSVIVEEPAHGSADLQTAMDVANAYAQNIYGVILDTSLDFDNSGYRFPANAPANCTQEFLNDKACGIVDYTFNQLMAVNQKTIDDVRSAEFLCNVYIYAEGNNIYAYCVYA